MYFQPESIGMLNLDTHILLFALDDAVTPAERKLLASEPWGVSATSLGPAPEANSERTLSRR